MTGNLHDSDSESLNESCQLEQSNIADVMSPGTSTCSSRTNASKRNKSASDYRNELIECERKKILLIEQKMASNSDQSEKCDDYHFFMSLYLKDLTDDDEEDNISLAQLAQNLRPALSTTETHEFIDVDQSIAICASATEDDTVREVQEENENEQEVSEEQFTVPTLIDGLNAVSVLRKIVLFNEEFHMQGNCDDTLIKIQRELQNVSITLIVNMYCRRGCKMQSAGTGPAPGRGRDVAVTSLKIRQAKKTNRTVKTYHSTTRLCESKNFTKTTRFRFASHRDDVDGIWRSVVLSDDGSRRQELLLYSKDAVKWLPDKNKHHVPSATAYVSVATARFGLS
ncbi:hypothetical protein RR48_01310 [Papilio machaon]|uniref:Uncharacterized protein n=1 Tax=Papilio machaon TaxID=76193 RepID=A0A0N1PJF1_PAPMA|nr:hypothetical protein RR48_01310 [Papilio machaon]